MMNDGDSVRFGRCYRIELDIHDDGDCKKQCWLVSIIDKNGKPVGSPSQADVNPYRSDIELVKLWIVAGLPLRGMLGKTCPLDRDDLLEILAVKRKCMVNSCVMQWDGRSLTVLLEAIRFGGYKLSVAGIEADTPREGT